MGTLARTAAIALLLAAAPASANEITAVARSSGIRIHGVDETRNEWCATDADGRLWLTVPGGRRFELVTTTEDAMIANPGDGSFHPYDEAQVRAALAAVRFPLEGLDVE